MYFYTTKRFLVVLLLLIEWLTLLDAFVIQNESCNCEPCNRIPVHYHELGCTPIYSTKNSCCPERFECPNFSEYDKTKCYTDGRSYDIGEHPTFEYRECHLRSCVCQEGSSGRAMFTCPEDDREECISDDNYNDPASENCIKIYQDFNDCCPKAKEICDIDEINKHHKCQYNGIDYWEGQTIYPATTETDSYLCECNTEFNNSIEFKLNKNCYKIRCNIELHHLDNIQNGCIPIYYGDLIHCPIEFKCPTSEKTKQLPSNENVCEFNNINYKRGEKIDSLGECIKCSCDYPPMLSCYRKSDC